MGQRSSALCSGSQANKKIKRNLPQSLSYLTAPWDDCVPLAGSYQSAELHRSKDSLQEPHLGRAGTITLHAAESSAPLFCVPPGYPCTTSRPLPRIVSSGLGKGSRTFVSSPTLSLQEHLSESRRKYL